MHLCKTPLYLQIKRLLRRPPIEPPQYYAFYHSDVPETCNFSPVWYIAAATAAAVATAATAAAAAATAAAATATAAATILSVF